MANLSLTAVRQILAASRVSPGEEEALVLRIQALPLNRVWTSTYCTVLCSGERG